MDFTLEKLWENKRKLSSPKKNLILLIGSDGTDKIVHRNNIVNNFGCVYISTEEMLREAEENISNRHHEIVALCKKLDRLVPGEIICSMILNVIRSSTATRFVLDDFPNHKEHIGPYQDFLAIHVRLETAFFLHCSEDVSITRILGTDDPNHPEREALLAKLTSHYKELTPVMEYFHNKGQLREIDARQASDEVFEDIKEAIQAIHGSGDFYR